MFYQEALPKFWVVFYVDSLLIIGDRHWKNLAATFEKVESENSLPFARNGCLCMWVPIFVWVLIIPIYGTLIKAKKCNGQSCCSCYSSQATAKHTHTHQMLTKYIKGVTHKSCFVERDISSTIWLPTFRKSVQHNLKLLLKSQEFRSH